MRESDLVARNEQQLEPLERLRVLVSVSNKEGLAKFFHSLGQMFPLEIIATGSTAQHLIEAGIEVTPVEEITGLPKLLDGRVKTLHSAIATAILADQQNPEHMRQLEQLSIKPFDMVVVNLYPFEEVVKDEKSTLEEVIENIDIGGPTALRAAAKNFQSVIAVCRPRDYSQVIKRLQEKQNLSFDQRRELAEKVFSLTRDYNGLIIEYFSNL